MAVLGHAWRGAWLRFRLQSQLHDQGQHQPGPPAGEAHHHPWSLWHTVEQGDFHRPADQGRDCARQARRPDQRHVQPNHSSDVDANQADGDQREVHHLGDAHRNNSHASQRALQARHGAPRPHKGARRPHKGTSTQFEGRLGVHGLARSTTGCSESSALLRNQHGRVR